VSGVCVFAARTCGISFGAVGGRGDRISVGISFGAVGNIVFFLSSHACGGGGGGGGRRQYNIFPIFPCVRAAAAGGRNIFPIFPCVRRRRRGAVGNIKKFWISGLLPMRAGGRLWDPTSRSGLPPMPAPPRAEPPRAEPHEPRLRAYRAPACVPCACVRPYAPHTPP
jgi:hypothetical protein